MKKRDAWTVILLTVAVVACWGFPNLWYKPSQAESESFWLGEQTSIDGWAYQASPVSKAAERVLVADRLVNGEFTHADGEIIRVFSAKRYKENPNEIGLFVHTPDRCWTESGWDLEAPLPDLITVPIQSVPIRFERRIFSANGQRELVYFAGLTGGRPLPYRMDHNLSVGLRYQLKKRDAQRGTRLRASDERLWARVWEAFLSRQPLLGPKQFVRISTPVGADGEAAADERLQEFLPKWLVRTDYQEELRLHLEAAHLQETDEQ